MFYPMRQETDWHSRMAGYLHRPEDLNSVK
jgi:hypothetical protein